MFVEAVLSLGKRKAGNSRFPRVGRIPFRSVKPAYQKDSDRRSNINHVIADELLIQRYKQVRIPAAFRFDNSGDRIKRPPVSRAPHCVY